MTQKFQDNLRLNIITILEIKMHHCNLTCLQNICYASNNSCLCFNYGIFMKQFTKNWQIIVIKLENLLRFSTKVNDFRFVQYSTFQNFILIFDKYLKMQERQKIIVRNLYWQRTFKSRYVVCKVKYVYDNSLDGSAYEIFIPCKQNEVQVFILQT